MPETRDHGVKVLRPDFDPAGFLSHVRGAAARVLLLDYDGTLAPFRVDPMQARPYEGVRGRLDTIRRGATRLVVVSGRPAREVRELLGLDPVPEVWGTHGWERALPGREPPRVDLPEEARRGLDEAARAEAAGKGPGRLERKPAALALHVRGLDAGAAERTLSGARSAWEPLATRHGLELREFDGGLELRVPGRDKGEAVRTVLSEARGSSPAGDVGAAYLGDDETDEDAFRAMRGRGAAILVRPRLRETAADAWIRPPAGLLRFLDDWIEASTS
jgi:trehalose-phosphatase